jgi:hypothetical protein
VCIISGLREELLDSSIRVAAMSSLFESVSGLHGELVLRNSAARTATHRRFGSARAVCTAAEVRHGRCLHLGTCQSCSRAVSRPLTGRDLN